MSVPSVLAIALPAVTIQRSAVVSCVRGGSPARTMRAFALMFVGPLNSREFERWSASFSFHRASVSAAAQNIVLPIGRLGTGGAGATLRPARWLETTGPYRTNAHTPTAMSELLCIFPTSLLSLRLIV